MSWQDFADDAIRSCKDRLAKYASKRNDKNSLQCKLKNHGVVYSVGHRTVKKSFES